MAKKQINEIEQAEKVGLQDLLLIQDTNGENFNITVDQLYDAIENSTSGELYELSKSLEYLHARVEIIDTSLNSEVDVSLGGVNELENSIYFQGNNYNFTNNYYDGFLIDITSTDDWTFILPRLSLIPIGYTITFKNLTNITYKGYLVPYSTETIDSISGSKEVGGKVEVSMRKESESNWEIVELIQHVAYEEEQYKIGDTTIINHNEGGEPDIIIEYVNSDIIILNHNSGKIPIIQVWAEDGIGGYTDINVDIDHEWSNKNTSTIHLGEIDNGRLLYIIQQ